MASFTDEAIKRFKDGVTSDLETALIEAIAKTIETRAAEFKG